MNTQHYLIPQHEEGVSTDLDHYVSEPLLEDAEDLFVEGKDRMLDVNKWASLLTSPLTVHLADHHGKPVNRTAHRGDHLCLTPAGSAEGCEWVVIESLEYDDYPDDLRETFAIRLHPVDQPERLEDSDHFIELASGTFVIERIGREVHASYHWRDRSDPEETHSLLWHRITGDQWLTIIRSFIE